MTNTHPLSRAKWIGARPECQSPVLIRRFNAGDVSDATLYVTGLGYFEARINGMAVTEDRFLPLVTDYEPRDLSKFIYPLSDHTTHRIYYSRFDVTGLIHEGENILTVQLGNGWYRQTERVAEGATSFGDVLKTIFSLQMTPPTGRSASIPTAPKPGKAARFSTISSLSVKWWIPPRPSALNKV